MPVGLWGEVDLNKKQVVELALPLWSELIDVLAQRVCALRLTPALLAVSELKLGDEGVIVVAVCKRIEAACSK